MTRLLLLLGLVACYSPSYRDCDVLCASGTCPSGFRCEGGVCRAPGASGACGSMTGDTMKPADADIDGNPMLDTDGDGINDSIDNCRSIMNPQQYNEDGDQYGDVCDPCPPLATYLVNGQPMDANLDADNDMVGNGCDPNPTAFGDRILLFDGFDQQMPATAFGPLPPQFGSGMVKIVAPASADWAAVAFGVTYDLAKRQVVRTGVRINQVFPTTVNGAGALYQFDGSSRGAACLFDADAAGVGNYSLVETNSNQGIVIDTMPYNGPPAQDVAASKRIGSTTFECALFPGSVLLTGPANVPVMPNTRAGIYARGVDAEFRWVLIVESP